MSVSDDDADADYADYDDGSDGNDGNEGDDDFNLAATPTTL